MKKLCLIVLLCLVAITAHAETGWFGGTFFRVDCLPELQSIDIHVNDVTRFDDYDFTEENRLKWLKNNYFTFENEDKRDIEAETTCKFKDGIYTIQFRSIYQASNTVSVTIKKDEKTLLDDIIIYDQWSLHHILTPILRFNVQKHITEAFSMVYAEAMADRLAYIYLPFSDDTAVQKILEHPEKWEKENYLADDDSKVLIVHCDEFMEHVEIQLTRIKDKNIKTMLNEKAEELAEKGIYAFETINAPEIYQTTCSFAGNTYEIKVDKKTQLTLSINETPLINDVRLYEPERNEVITYLRYLAKADLLQKHDSVQLVWWDKNKRQFKYNRLPSQNDWYDYDKNKRLWRLENMSDFYDMEKDICSMVWCD